MKLITTSWDDGHVLDLKLAEYLAKYNLPGTFYIPRSNTERPVMSTAQMQTLAASFEIGSHGLQHARFYSKNKKFLEREICGSYQWLADVVGEAPISFCFPGGVYDKATLDAVFNSGYKLARTTALFSTKCFKNGVATDTTLHAYPHSKFTYTKHLMKRCRWTTLALWLKDGAQNKLAKLTEYYLDKISQQGGCFHFWGHSWEIEKLNLWQQLEDVFKILADRTDFTYVQNRELITDV